MYESHFKLGDKPFRLTPDLRARYPEPSQQIALNTLELALQDGEGFIKVVGEVGLGKTLLCRTLLAQLKTPFVTAWIPDPQISAGNLQQSIAAELGIELPGRPSLSMVHQRLQSGLLALAAAGKRPVLLVDEAQALPPRTLETVRLLTNLETERRKLLQVVLFGQPELDRRLAREDLRQLRQRITFTCNLNPLSSTAVGDYILYRTRAAGAEQALFTPAAVRQIAKASHGVPRLVNVLCHKALMAAWGRGIAQAGRAEVRRAIADTESVGNRFGSTVQLRRFLRVAVVLLTTVFAWNWMTGGPGPGS